MIHKNILWLLLICIAILSNCSPSVEKKYLAKSIDEDGYTYKMVTWLHFWQIQTDAKGFAVTEMVTNGYTGYKG